MPDIGPMFARPDMSEQKMGDAKIKVAINPYDTLAYANLLPSQQDWGHAEGHVAELDDLDEADRLMTQAYGRACEQVAERDFPEVDLLVTEDAATYHDHVGIPYEWWLDPVRWEPLAQAVHETEQAIHDNIDVHWSNRWTITMR